jgi:hypothetical protein
MSYYVKHFFDSIRSDFVCSFSNPPLFELVVCFVSRYLDRLAASFYF